jgi:hypothetical protein
MADRKPWLERHWKWVRDVALFVGGMAGVAWETLSTTADARPILVGVFAAMMGLPLFLRSDEKRDEKGGSDDEDEA